MIPLNNRKILILFILAGVVIAMYDAILHSLFSVVHIAFEWFELALEELIEHIFHTNRQQSQIIVFYLMWLIALYGFYRLWRALPGFYSRFKERFIAVRSQYKLYLIDYWREQSSIQKIKWVASFTVSVSCLAFFAFN
ncbi:MAG: hypothetical protein PHY54_14850 [Methylococcales bacterium]|nr:hypothetical protein [Methylococcales bacterium]